MLRNFGKGINHLYQYGSAIKKNARWSGHGVMLSMDKRVAEAIYTYRIEPEFDCPWSPCVGESDVCGAYMAGCTGGKA